MTTTERPGTGGGSGLRGWQQRALAAMEDWSEGAFLISAAPGAGKTRPALEFARRELQRGRVDGLVIACPTAPLTRQWARAAHALGLELAPDADSPRPPRGLPRRRRDLRADRQFAAGLGRRHARAHAGDRRRGASPRRGARLGRGFSRGVRRGLALAAAVRGRRSARTRRRSRASSTTPTAWPSPTSPTPTPTPCVTGSAGRWCS